MLLNFMDEVQDVEELDTEAKQQHQHHLKQIKHATHHMKPSNIHLVNHVCIILQVCTYIHMLNKNTLGVKKVRGQSEATMVI